MLLMSAEHPAFLTPRFRRALPSWTAAVLLAVPLLLTPRPVAADENPDDPRWHQELRSQRGSVPDDGFLLAHGAVIGDIYVQTDDICGDCVEPESMVVDRRIGTRSTNTESRSNFTRGH